ncbi:MAG: hypothetical protein CVU08_11555 [Bacteroidetes bacterium HGW-Bacteroidetes-3]|nr:MAG: hypothetical protein CVU08_11555 [Bacteroidetes bacterium HGW-Bacteroidetes-3]
MKKIGILTQPLIRNYGGILQAYALQLVLKRMGNEVLIIDMHYKKNWFLESFKSTIKVILNSFGLKLNQKQFIINPNLKEFNEIYKNNVLFINKNINKTKRINCIKNYSDIAEYGFEAVIVGSDQVWRPEFSPNMPNYFLDFLKDIEGVKRISYAASFGVDYWKFTETEIKLVRRMILRSLLNTNRLFLSAAESLPKEKRRSDRNKIKEAYLANLPLMRSLKSNSFKEALINFIITRNFLFFNGYSKVSSFLMKVF